MNLATLDFSTFLKSPNLSILNILLKTPYWVAIMLNKVNLYDAIRKSNTIQCEASSDFTLVVHEVRSNTS